MSDDGLIAALARCQAKFPAIVKSHTNPAFKGSQYADVADVLAAVRPVLAAEGIVVSQFTRVMPGGSVVLVTTVRASIEEWIESSFPLPVDGLTAQQVGSLLTYHRRYQLCAILGVHPVGDDDDGNLAATAPVKEAPKYYSSQTPVDSNALAAAHPPDKPIAAMTVAELIRYARDIGVPVSGSKSDMVRQLQPYVDAATGEEPWDVSPVEGEVIGSGHLELKRPEEVPFEPKVYDAESLEGAVAAAKANRAVRDLPPDRRASVRRGDS